MVILILNVHIITTLRTLYTVELFGILLLNLLCWANLPLPIIKLSTNSLLQVYISSPTQRCSVRLIFLGHCSQNSVFSGSRWNELLSRSAYTTVILGSPFPSSEGRFVCVAGEPLFPESYSIIFLNLHLENGYREDKFLMPCMYQNAFILS